MDWGQEEIGGKKAAVEVASQDGEDGSEGG